MQSTKRLEYCAFICCCYSISIKICKHRLTAEREFDLISVFVPGTPLFFRCVCVFALFTNMVLLFEICFFSSIIHMYSSLFRHRNGTITNWNGIQMIMAVSTHYMYHPNTFGYRILYYTISEYRSVVSRAFVPNRLCEFKRCKSHGSEIAMPALNSFLRLLRTFKWSETSFWITHDDDHERRSSFRKISINFEFNWIFHSWHSCSWVLFRKVDSKISFAGGSTLYNWEFSSMNFSKKKKQNMRKNE